MNMPSEIDKPCGGRGRAALPRSTKALDFVQLCALRVCNIFHFQLDRLSGACYLSHKLPVDGWSISRGVEAKAEGEGFSAFSSYTIGAS